MSSLLGYIPFLDPITALYDGWYLLLIPLSFGIAVIWKALRLPTLEHYWRQVATMTVQIVLGIIVLAIVLMVFVQIVIPMLPAE